MGPASMYHTEEVRALSRVAVGGRGSGEAPGGAREEERKGKWRGRLGLVDAVRTTPAMLTETPGRGLHGGRLAAHGQVVVGPGDSGHQTEGREVLRARREVEGLKV